MEAVRRNPVLIISVIVILIIVLLYSRLESPQKLQDTDTERAEMNPAIQDSEDSECIPTFRDGGGPYYISNSPFRDKIAPASNNGERLIVTGKILQNDCKSPVANAVLDIWQANESGNYEDEWYRGQVRTGSDGSYSFETVVPKGYGEGTGYRPPHIHFKVYVDGDEAVTSQMFFPEVRGQQGFEDAYIMRVETKRDGDMNTHVGYHEIILP